MLSQLCIQALLDRLELPSSGRAYIDRTRNSEPARLVGSGTLRNTPVRYASQRMGRVIQAESDTVEGAFVRLCEYDERNVLEFWDQPPSVPLIIVNKRGHRQRVAYTPDFLVLRTQGPVVVECKPQSKVMELLERRPHDWIGEEGYRFRPAFEYFSAIGLVHEVWIPDERSSMRSSNIDLLLAARRGSALPNEPALRTRISTYLLNRLIASIGDLCRELKLPDATVLLRGINEGWLYAPLDQYLLSRPQDALVALNQHQFAMGHEALALCRHSPVTGAVAVAESVPSVAAAAVMLQRHKELSGARASTVSPRTMRRYRQHLRNGNGDIRALLPQTRPGNRKPRLTPEHEAFLLTSITQHYTTAVALSKASSHLKYKNAFDDAKACGVFARNEFAVSLNTYLKRIARLDAEELARARGGTRAANAAAAPVDRECTSAPVNRPFEVAHVDHYLGDRALALRYSGRRKFTRKPWISVLQDDCTSEVLAMVIGFRSPSRKVLAELLRDCVRRHGRLPETIVSDCGSDFQSVFYESTLALLGVHKKDRPTAAPRFGGKLERLFGKLKTAILWRAPGSTRNDGKGRSVSPSHRSHQLAEQDLIDFYHELEDAIFSQLNVHLHGERRNSPDAVAAAGLALYPMSGVPVDYDQKFMVATSVAAPNESYIVDPSRGINPLGRWYWHPKLGRMAKSKVEVRLDPWDEDLVYAMVQGEWVCCRGRGTLYHESRDLVTMICCAAIHLDGRQELAEAQHEGDLALSRHLSARIPVSRPDESEMLSERPDIPLPDIDDVSAITVNWSLQS